MKRNLRFMLGLMLLGAAALAAERTPAIIGTWAGESKCTVAGSPCHDEHVVYVIKQSPQRGDRYAIDAYKIVSGERGFMGELDCRYPAANGTLRCIGRRPDDVWTFTVSADAMTGTLTVGTPPQLYRRVQVTRSTAH